jgi:hypothetical protein
MGKSRCARIVAIMIGCRMAAMIVKGPPHWGHCSNIDSEHPFEQPGSNSSGRAPRAGGGASAWSAERVWR